MLTQTNPTNVTPSYSRANNFGQKAPIYYVTFGLVTGPLGVNSAVVPYAFCTSPVQNASQTMYRYMSTPTSAPNTISLVQYQASLSQITFELQDQNSVVTGMVTNWTMKNRLVYLYKGYAWMNQADYAQIYVGQINDWAMNPDATGYIFTITDPQKQLTTDILKGHSQLVKDFTPSDTIAYLTTSFYFANSTDLQDGNGPRNYVKINDSLYSYIGNASGIIVDNLVTWTYIGHGTATASTPQWVGGKGYFTDNGATWVFLGPVTATLTASAWVANTSYVLGNTVSAGGNVYKCVGQGTSAPSGVGPTAVGYNIGNKVYNQGNVYQCVVAGTSSQNNFQDGGIIWAWVSYGLPTSTILQWVASGVYAAGVYVYNQSNIYYCLQGGTAASNTSGPLGIFTGPTGQGSTASALYGMIQVVLNSNGATPSQVHQAGSKVDNYILFQGNPVTIMLQIIMSTGTGSNWSGTGTNYDVLPASQGIGVPWNLVNITGFTTKMNTFISWFYFSQFFMAQTNAIQFFQDHIFQQCQCFLFTNRSGQLDINFVYMALPTSNYTQIDDSNIIGIPQFDASLQTGNNFVNEVDVLWDYQTIADFYVNENIYINNASQQKYEECAISEVDCQFVQTQYKGGQIANRISNIMLNLYGNPLPIITVKCFAQLQPVNAGDTILLASSQVPNIFTGQRGGTVLCLCISAAPDYQNDQMTLTLYATGYATNKKYAVIGPAGMPNYPNESTAQKNYVFISQLVAGNFSVGQMGNGDAGYYVTG